MVEKNDRLIILDILRGIFVTALIIIHLRLHPNFLLLLTGRSKLWVSVGEGFFLISGFLLGYLNRFSWTENPQNSTNKIIKRALKLYLWSIFTTFIFVLWGNILPIEAAKEGLWQLTNQNFSQFILKVISFQYIYGWADYLSLYTVYIFLTPVAFFLIKKVGYFVPLVISLFLWFFRGDDLFKGMQIIFFFSLTAGFCYERVVAFIKTIPINRFNRYIYFNNFLFYSTLLLSIFSVYYFEHLVKLMSILGVGAETTSYLLRKNLAFNYYFDKQSVGVGRLLISPIWFFGVLYVAIKFKEKLLTVFGGIFRNFGENSLKVYLIHSFVIYPIPWLLLKFNIHGYISYSLISFVVVVVVYYINDRTKNFKV